MVRSNEVREKDLGKKIWTKAIGLVLLARFR